MRARLRARVVGASRRGASPHIAKRGARRVIATSGALLTVCGAFLTACGAFLTACGAGSTATPLPAGPPPEYEAPRPFDGGDIDELAPTPPAAPPP